MSTRPIPDRVLREALLALQAHDLAVRDELDAAGALYGGYHPRMAAVHRDHAEQLRSLVAEHGWPHAGLAGDDGAEAAWLVAQHAIGEPAFMRDCLARLGTEAEAGRVPRWQHALLHDRVCVSEGRPQHFGTQFELTPRGPVLCPVEAPEALDERRRAVGLAPIAQRLQALEREHPPARWPTAEAYHAQQAAAQAWRVQVGWATADPAALGARR